MGNAQVSLRVRTPHQECSDRKHLPGGGTSTESSYRAALGAGEPSRELPSLSSTGRAAAAAFPGITQNKGSPKAVPTFQAQQALGAASCSPWKCPGGENPPGVQPEATGSTGGTHRTCPGFGHTGAAPEGTEAQQPQSHPTLFVFQFQGQDPPWDPAVAALPRLHSPSNTSREPGMDLG